MAEIPIEKRKKRTIWPWILGIVVVLVLIWVLADNNVEVEDGTAFRQDENVMTDKNDNTMAQQEDGRVEQFIQYVEDNGNEISQNHEYTRQGLLFLADALDELHNRIGSTAENLNTEEIRTKAQSLTENVTSSDHANTIKDAFLTAANAVQRLQTQYFPNMNADTDELSESANELEGNELATEQGDKIEKFFEKAADKLDEMTTESARQETEVRSFDSGLN